MRARILLFSVIKDLLQRDVIDVEIPTGSTVEGLFAEIVHIYPAVAPWQKVARIAINATYVANQTVVHEGDEIALIPPVAGG